MDDVGSLVCRSDEREHDRRDDRPRHADDGDDERRDDAGE